MTVDAPMPLIGKKPDGKKYKNCRQMNVHRYSDDPCVSKAITRLAEILDYKGGKREKQCKILVLDLYHCYNGDKTRYIKLYLSPNSYEKIQRYNYFCITYDIVKNLTEKLLQHEFIEFKRGFNYAVNESSKIKALPKLISFLEDDFGIKPCMVKTWKDQEVIILKEKTKKVWRNGKLVKIKKKKEYDDDDKTIKLRKNVYKYNVLLANTYLDIDDHCFKYVRKLKELDRNNEKKHDPLRIDLSLKRVYRVFTGDFEHGGRWYGPFWQGCPEALRLRIIINGSHTVEFDFSGLHIHLLYALKKQKLGDKEPYIVSKKDDINKLRRIYKLIMLTSVNCKNDIECIAAVEDQLIEEMEEEPDKYPDEMPDLEAMLLELKEHHKPIADFINKKTGLMLQNIDSNIVEEVINQMTDSNIPVLSVHDSFICREEDAELVHKTMKEAFVKCIMRPLGGNRSKFRITAEEIATTTCDDSKHVFPQYRRLNKKTIPYEQIEHAYSVTSTVKYKTSTININKIKRPARYSCINTNTIKTPSSIPSLRQLKYTMLKHVLKNDYISRLKEYQITNNTEVNIVLRIIPLVVYI